MFSKKLYKKEFAVKLAIIGLGYVGLPLAVEFGKQFETVGFDINSTRIEELKKGIDRTLEVEEEELESAKKLTFTTSIKDIEDANIYIVTVPTPIDKHKNPNLTPLIMASRTVGRVLKKGDIVIYESTVYPGCTREVCVPELERESGLKFNKDFFCGYSPERINPGDKNHRLPNIKKVTSGSTPQVAKKVDNLYKAIIKAGTHLAPSIEVAEAAKVIENAQRDINIAFVNELALIFDKLGIDTLEVLEAAGTKWNFLPFRPGLVGGHCIGVDPYYLAYKAKEIGFHPQIILAGRRTNDEMPYFVANKVVKLLIQKGHTVKGSKTLVLGITFKEGCPDVRNSKVVDLINELKEFGIEVEVFDPLANKEEVKREYKIELLSSLPSLKKYDSIILAVAHKEFKEIDLTQIPKKSVVVDLKGVWDKKMVDKRL